MDIEALRHAIPAAIDALGGDSRVSELDQDAWAIFRGSVTGYIALIASEDEADADPVVHVTFPILRVPAEDAEPLLRHLLELNHQLGNFASFSLDPHGRVWLGAGRFAAELDESELRVLIAQVAELADRYDDELLDQFGRQLAIE
ncbi:MAG TPA: YbjN domain-containing protein [Gemmatimonadales bacterium]|nr:YbjN domain-containing protein [Gemmatimonadales bacterium]